jgi:hypothetical protein
LNSPAPIHSAGGDLRFLHTKESLSALLAKVGFTFIDVRLALPGTLDFLPSLMSLPWLSAFISFPWLLSILTADI